jgi:hypothetical protein
MKLEDVMNVILDHLRRAGSADLFGRRCVDSSLAALIVVSCATVCHAQQSRPTQVATSAHSPAAFLPRNPRPHPSRRCMTSVTDLDQG